MLDLAFVRFEVLNAKGNVKAALEEGKGDSVGAYTIGVGALMPGASLLSWLESTGRMGACADGTTLAGYRHLPLYDGMGDQHLYSTLFIKSRVVATGIAG